MTTDKKQTFAVQSLDTPSRCGYVTMNLPPTQTVLEELFEKLRDIYVRGLRPDIALVGTEFYFAMRCRDGGNRPMFAAGVRLRLDRSLGPRELRILMLEEDEERVAIHDAFSAQAKTTSLEPA